MHIWWSVAQTIGLPFSLAGIHVISSVLEMWFEACLKNTGEYFACIYDNNILSYIFFSKKLANKFNWF